MSLFDLFWHVVGWAAIAVAVGFVIVAWWANKTWGSGR